MYVCMHVCMFVCMYVHMYGCLYVYIYVCVIYVYVCMYVCMNLHFSYRNVRMYVVQVFFDSSRLEDERSSETSAETNTGS